MYETNSAFGEQRIAIAWVEQGSSYTVFLDESLSREKVIDFAERY